MTKIKLSPLQFLLKPAYILCIALSFCLCFLSYLVYISHSTNLKNDLKNEARYIANALQEVFDWSDQLTTHISKQIAVVDTQDINAITKIIGKESSMGDNNSLLWMNIGWINSKNLLVFNRKYGIMTPPHDLSQRPYVQQAHKKQWKFTTSQVVIGTPSGLRQISGGIGITDCKGKYLGVLAVCFDLVDLHSKVRQKLSMANFSENNLSYVVLDQDLHIILQSPDNEIDVESSYYKDTFGDSNFFLNDEGTITGNIKFKGINYTHYKKVKNYPYYVLTGFNPSIMNWHFLWKLSPFIIGLLIMSIGCAILMYFNRKQILKHMEISEKAKLNFLKGIKNEMKAPLNAILAYSEIMSKSLGEEIDIGITTEKQKEMIDGIHNFALNLNDLTADTLDLSSIEINSIIQECVLIHSQTALIKGIKIKTSFHPHLPPLVVDELRFKQAIIGLISLSLEFCPQGSVIKIYTALKSLNEQNFFEIIIQDNGFALTEEAIRRIHERLEGETNGSGTHFEFSTIEKLIKMHSGTLLLESEWNQGKKITVTLPYKKQNQSNNKAEKPKIDNVHNLFNKELVS